jgi:hypothetical protein
MGKHEHPLYKRYRFIVDVTSNPNDPNYHAYGGSMGIENKFRDFEHFCDYVESKLGLPLGAKKRLYRKDPTDHYRPGNLAWGDARDVSYKQKNVYLIKYKGKIKTLGDWAIATGLPYARLLDRHKAGWPPAELLGFKKRKPRYGN